MKPPLLIYTSFDSARLQYVLEWIFTERMQIAWHLTSDLREWEQYKGPRLNYSNDHLPGQDILTIRCNGLLQQSGLRAPALNINRWKRSTVLFYNQPGAAVPFDIFAAVFYLLSRYEEYLDYQPDKHGRFPKEASAAFQFSFLQQPVVDEWICKLSGILKEMGLEPVLAPFRFILSYDIDLAWRYLHKGPKRNIAAMAKDLLSLKPGQFTDRLRVLSGKKDDPFYCFDYLDAVHQQYPFEVLFFLLLGKYGRFDKNTDPSVPAMQSLIKRLSGGYTAGIHPSYGTHTEPGRLQTEIDTLEYIAGHAITKSRQHFIKFRLPDTYQDLLAAGIREDYSMGYASANGFRAGTSVSFPWYNIASEKVTELRVHPFVFMDATALYYNRGNKNDTYMEWERLLLAVQQSQGTFISVWHNFILSNDREYKGWRSLYEKCLHIAPHPGGQ